MGEKLGHPAVLRKLRGRHERRQPMTPIEKSTLSRVAGFIEGVSYGVDAKAADALTRAVEMLERLLERGQDNATGNI